MPFHFVTLDIDKIVKSVCNLASDLIVDDKA